MAELFTGAADYRTAPDPTQPQEKKPDEAGLPLLAIN